MFAGNHKWEWPDLLFADEMRARLTAPRPPDIRQEGLQNTAKRAVRMMRPVSRLGAVAVIVVPPRTTTVSRFFSDSCGRWAIEEHHYGHHGRWDCAGGRDGRQGRPLVR